MNNEDRAENGNLILEHYQGLVRGDAADALTDLLADLMHACDDATSLDDFAESLRIARDHYEAELDEEENQG